MAFYLAYVVSFLTIGAAWLAHTIITDRLARADLDLLRINLLLLLVVAVLPFPTRLVAESLEEVEDERVFVALYGLVLLGIRLLVTALDAYARREQLYVDDDTASSTGGPSIVAAFVVYDIAIVVGLLLPAAAVAFYCAIAVALVVPFGEVRRLLSRRQ